MLAKIGTKLTNLLVAIAAAVLAMMMFLTALDVALRYLFNRPLPGALELVEYMMAILIPICILYCEHQKRHVAVELIIKKFPMQIRHAALVVTGLLSTVFVFALFWQSILQIREIYISNVTSAVLLIPSYPFVFAMTIGIGGFSIILFQHLLETLSGRTPK